jgi:hypothetical protein
MTTKANIGQELLKQMGDTSAETPDCRKIPMMRIIERDAAGVRRLKRIVIIFWLLVIISFIVACTYALNVRGIESDLFYMSWLLAGITVITFQAVFLIAVILTISLFVTSRSLTMHQVQARLTGIEEQLKKICQDK